MRQRRRVSESVNYETTGNGIAREQMATSSPHRKVKRWTLLQLVCILIHLLCLSWTLFGSYLAFTKLHNHDECDMTWSHRKFIEIPLTVGAPPPDIPYKLFKFTDARDPRHLHTTSNNWCATVNGTFITPVLYIPGHGGNYQQARSLGAHLLGLTKRSMSRVEQSAILRHQQQLQALWDVYTVDFLEEWTALHADYLIRQTEFVEQVLEFLWKSCGPDESSLLQPFVLVGHSMGGWVARSTASNTSVPIQSIITLATPHTHPVLSWSVWNWHQQHIVARNEEEDKIPIISVSGGLRDEMIPPEATELDSSSRLHRSIMSTDIMAAATDRGDSVQPLFGMDHQAIVWCHNLLETVVRWIKQPESISSFDQLVFSTSVLTQRTALSRTFGTLKAAAVTTGMVYNVDWLVFAYAFVGALQGTLSRPSLVSSVAIPLCFATISRFSHQFMLSHHLGWFSWISLSFSASTVFWVIRYALRCTVSTRYILHTWTLFTVILMLLYVWRSWKSSHNGLKAFCSLVLALSIVFLTTLTSTPKKRAHENSGDLQSLTAWLLPVQILLLTGDFFVLPWTNGTNLLITAVKIIVPPLAVATRARQSHFIPRRARIMVYILVAYGVHSTISFVGRHHPVVLMVIACLIL